MWTTKRHARELTMEDVLAHNQKIRQPAQPTGAANGNGGGVPTQPLKYRNQPCVWQGLRFDSKRELGRWLELKSREAAGEIEQLERQVSYALHGPYRGSSADLDLEAIQQAWQRDEVDLDHAHDQVYLLIREIERLRSARGPEIGLVIPDFRYTDREDGQTYVVDAKGYYPTLSRWKARHFELEYKLSLNLV